MRWCCGGGNSGGGGNNGDATGGGSSSSTNVGNSTASPGDLMTELSLKADKNSAKVSSKLRSGITNSNISDKNKKEKHFDIIAIEPTTSAMPAETTRRGVLKSSLKLFSSTSKSSTPKGVQYADEVRRLTSHQDDEDEEEVEEYFVDGTRDERRKSGDNKNHISQQRETDKTTSGAVGERDARASISTIEQQIQHSHTTYNNDNSHFGSGEGRNNPFTAVSSSPLSPSLLTTNSSTCGGAVMMNKEQLPQHHHQSAIFSVDAATDAERELQKQQQFDKYGPMLLRLHKIALYVREAGKNSEAERCAPIKRRKRKESSASTDSSKRKASIGDDDVPEFIDRLQEANWTIYATTRANVAHEFHAHRPVVIFVDERVTDCAAFTASLQNAPECDDVLTVVLRITNATAATPKTSALSNQQPLMFDSASAITGVALCEQYARLASRLRAIPALFAVVEEAEQPIKICDEHNIVQYVNRAYEYLTGRWRTDVLGSDASSELVANSQSTCGNIVGGVGNAVARTPQLPLPSPVATTGASPGSSATTPSTTTAGIVTSVVTDTQQLQQAGLPAANAPPAATQTALSSSVPQTVAAGTTAGGGANTAFVMPSGYSAIRRRSSEWHCITVPSCSTSPQFVYVKRGSTDAIGRDMSLKSLRSQSALVEAPITEALSVLDSVLHKCGGDEEAQQQVRDAIKILSSAELYAPTITRFNRDNDRIASGYYDGLIRLHHPSRQRKRSVVDAFRENQQRRVSGGSAVSSGGFTDSASTSSLTSSGAAGGNAARRRISTDVANALENENSWSFDVLELERVTENRPLSQLGVKIFDRWNVAETLRCSTDMLARWLQVIEANYQCGNAYHNATHAADVLQAASFFLDAESVGQFVQDQHAVAALLAATVHDLDHPGRGNAFLMNTRARLAVLYNDHSVLENHHVALAFQLTLTQPGVNIFARVAADEFAQIRQATIDMVLATDMSRHFEYLTKFQQALVVLPESEENRDGNSLTICRMMIKCADIANPTREWRLCYQWAMRIVVEYFEQTAEEMEKGLPLTMKGFDRETCNIPLTQCTFVDMFAREAFTAWCEFADLPQLLAQLETNYEKWKAQAADWDPRHNAVILQRHQHHGSFAPSGVGAPTR